MGTSVHAKAYSQMFIAALFIAVKNGKQPSAGARITNAGVSAQEYYSAIRRDKTTDAPNGLGGSQKYDARWKVPEVSPHTVGLHAQDVLEKVTTLGQEADLGWEGAWDWL